MEYTLGNHSCSRSHSSQQKVKGNLHVLLPASYRLVAETLHLIRGANSAAHGAWGVDEAWDKRGERGSLSEEETN